MIETITNFLTANPYILLVIGVWEIIWKGIALWKSGRGSQKVWFICILIFNTIGILPIIYILWFSKKRKK